MNWERGRQREGPKPETWKAESGRGWGSGKERGSVPPLTSYRVWGALWQQLHFRGAWWPLVELNIFIFYSP